MIWVNAFRIWKKTLDELLKKITLFSRKNTQVSMSTFICTNLFSTEIDLEDASIERRDSTSYTSFLSKFNANSRIVIGLQRSRVPFDSIFADLDKKRSNFKRDFYFHRLIFYILYKNARGAKRKTAKLRKSVHSIFSNFWESADSNFTTVVLAL